MQPRTLDNIKNPYPTTFVKRDELLGMIYDMACKQGFDELSREKISEHIGIAVGTVNYYFGTVDKMRSSIIRMAIAKKNLTILARGLATRNKAALAAPVELKKQAAELLYT